MQLKDASILIVDDEPALLEIYKGWFDREGCRTQTAENGAVALELTKTNHFDILISDIRMPVMDGIELARQIKKTNKYIPKIVFISGFSDLDERESFDLGVTAKLSKPMPRLSLVDVVRSCLLGREELWCDRPAGDPPQDLETVFESLLEALQKGLIAFGHGGVCVRSAFKAEVGAAIGLCLVFKQERRALAGQGIVRWTAPSEGQIGIEITYIDEENRSWVANAAERTDSISFIPRSSFATIETLAA